jgi:hypothetical protein
MSPAISICSIALPKIIAPHPRLSTTRAARQEAIKALRRLCREELSNGRVYIEELPGICDLFYSSSGAAYDEMD